MMLKITIKIISMIVEWHGDKRNKIKTKNDIYFVHEQNSWVTVIKLMYTAYHNI